MSVPSLAERRLTLLLFVGLALAACLVVLLVDHPAGDGSPTATTAAPSPPSRSTPSASAPTAPAASPSGIAQTRLPATTTSPATGAQPPQPTSTPGAADTPPPTLSASASATPTVDPPVEPPVDTPAPPALVTELPEPASAVNRLVPGFPDMLAPPAGTRIESSGVSNDGVRAQISLVATTTEPAEQLVDHYRVPLVDVGFHEARGPAEPVTSATFVRGPESVVVTVADERLTLFASVLPEPPPGRVDAEGPVSPRQDAGVPEGTTPAPEPEATATPTGAAVVDPAEPESDALPDATPSPEEPTTDQDALGPPDSWIDGPGR